jgi:hypothetical protein
MIREKELDKTFYEIQMKGYRVYAIMGLCCYR